LLEYSEAAKAITATFTTLDRHVKSRAHNHLDLKVLVPIGALCAASVVLLRYRNSRNPLWLNLSLFGFRSYLARHPPDQQS
jgi:hypothetical protein